MSRYIAAYDVSDDRIRRRVSRVLDGYGQRLQLSVYEVWLEPEELPDFRRRVGSLLSESDQFDLVPIDVHPQRIRLRWQTGIDEYEPVIVLG
ncbi:MAG TPA: CRISPR-associated endonuclease Cas2 [Isosphaeraceae bacterium]|jgi:CRISPR-associated protein Cas2|nr:CRISPR-associated endonuclease Cas2 [Isosphaeraceae bacterium]